MIRDRFRVWFMVSNRVRISNKVKVRVKVRVMGVSMFCISAPAISLNMASSLYP